MDHLFREKQIHLTDTIKYIKQKIRKKQIVVLCGAGISMKSPSNLPNAQILMKNVIEHFVGKFSSYIEDFDARPEVLFNIISKHEPQKLLTLIYQLLFSKSFNINHLLLAEFLSTGNNVITTNFDTLIEEACKNRVSFYKTFGKEETIVKQPIVFKIHGCIENKESLMLTINHINKGLSNEKFTLLKNLVKNKTILTLGYSGNDQLDIMPALQDCSYNQIIWINHNAECHNPRIIKPENPHIRNLERLIYLSLNTDNLVQGLVKEKEELLPRSIEISTRIAVDILMHLDKYEKIIDLTKNINLEKDLYLDIANYKARRSLHIDYDEKGKRKKLLFERINNLSAKEQDSFLPFIAQNSSTLEEISKFFKLLESKLKTDKNLDDEFYEAVLEVSFILSRHHKYQRAEKLLRKTLIYAKESGSLIIEARTHIIFSALLYFKNENHPENKTIIDAICHVDKAIFLLDKDIYNDDFFLSQAKNNKAMMLAILENYDGAIKLYTEVLNYYRNKNIGHYVSTLNNIASLYFRQEKFKEALRFINRAIRANKKTERGYASGEIYRLKARILMKNPKNNFRVRKINKLLQTALTDFERINNEEEILQTKNDLIKLLGKNPLILR